MIQSNTNIKDMSDEVKENIEEDLTQTDEEYEDSEDEKDDYEFNLEYEIPKIKENKVSFDLKELSFEDFEKFALEKMYSKTIYDGNYDVIKYNFSFNNKNNRYKYETQELNNFVFKVVTSFSFLQNCVINRYPLFIRTEIRKENDREIYYTYPEHLNTSLLLIEKDHIKLKNKQFYNRGGKWISNIPDSEGNEFIIQILKFECCRSGLILQEMIEDVKYHNSYALLSMEELNNLAPMIKAKFQVLISRVYDPKRSDSDNEYIRRLIEHNENNKNEKNLELHNPDFFGGFKLMISNCFVNLQSESIQIVINGKEKNYTLGKFKKLANSNYLEFDPNYIKKNNQYEYIGRWEQHLNDVLITKSGYGGLYYNEKYIICVLLNTGENTDTKYDNRFHGYIEEEKFYNINDFKGVKYNKVQFRPYEVEKKMELLYKGKREKVSNTPNKNLSNTPNRNVSNTPNRNVSNTPNKKVSNTPNRNVSNTPNKKVSNTPNINTPSSKVPVYSYQDRNYQDRNYQNRNYQDRNYQDRNYDNRDYRNYDDRDYRNYDDRDYRNDYKNNRNTSNNNNLTHNNNNYDRFSQPRDEKYFNKKTNTPRDNMNYGRKN